MKDVVVRICRCGCGRKVYSGPLGRPKELCDDAVAENRRIASRVLRERNREAYDAYQREYYQRRKAADPDFLKKRAAIEYTRRLVRKGEAK